MRAVDLIIKKRDKLELSKEEIQFFINEYTKGSIPDYQASAWAMAVMLNGMTHREITDLTLAMAASGEILDFTGVVDVVIDKHSTGGVGDKTSLVVLPLVVACGVPVGKMSGRGLGFTGGTLDKMESIPGFNIYLTKAKFIQQLSEVGMVLAGQTGDLAPADGKLYALRDVTGTVPSLPLIASSIMCKKIAAGAQRIVLDVKTGLGAFMQSVDEAKDLAKMMVEIARLADRRAAALISDMNQPLGNTIGNALEVREALETLQGNGPYDLTEHALEVASYMVNMSDKTNKVVEAREKVEQVLENGKAWEYFRRLVEVQGGDVSYVDNPEKLPKAKLIETVPAPRSGYLTQVHARIIGEMAVVLGAGRLEKNQAIDHAVGIEVHHKVGDKVEKDQPLFTIHADKEDDHDEVRQALLEAHQWSDEPVKPLPLFYDVVTDEQ
ncbi:MAG TPA: thymidine phosphorylase [Anaerolineales bacterium]|nr:thymidine phosphorylase [Anaerolineales bacterium]